MTTMTLERREAAITPKVRPIDLKFEVAAIPVSDVDRAKSFYGGLGWRLDADFVVGDTFRGVQVTPPGSPSSVHFGKGLTSAAPGSAGVTPLPKWMELGEPGGVNCRPRKVSPTTKSASSLQPSFS